MRFLRAQIGICLAMLAAAGIARAADGIEWSVKPSDCHPGDLVELRAVMTRTDFAEIELEVPKTDALHPVTRTTGPVRYHGGTYTQEITWIMQPTRAGNIELDGIKAHLKQGGRVTDFGLPARSLTVRSYGEGVDSPEPMSLPQTAPVARRPNRWLLLGLAAACLLVLILFLRSKAEPVAVPTSDVLDLKDLRNALDQSESPVSLMERILDGNTIHLAKPLREAMERSVYGGKFDRDELLRLLEKEEAP
jgi:hypothetical protein